ncbi:Slc4a10 [Symbiodinium sp. KB8]|nr:Slc4a10 [Symbiodinium sp. KB8]
MDGLSPAKTRQEISMLVGFLASYVLRGATSFVEGFLRRACHACVCGRGVAEAAVLASERGLSWREAKARLDATDDFQLNVLAALRLVFWHWMQPAAYVLLLYGWSDDPYFRSRSDFQVVMAIAVLVREVLYFGCTVLALVRCPAFLLVDVIATWRSGARGEVSESTSSCRAASAEAVYRYESGNIAHAPKKDYGPLDFTGKLAGGLRLDIRRFIAALAPAITFGSRFLDGTNGQFGVLTGNNLFDRLKLWLIWDPAKYPQYHYIQKLPISRVHLYTVVQVICLGILYGLKAIKETSVVFPFFMASLAIIRKAMRFMFTEDELKQLDSLPGEDEEEDAAMSKESKPDIVNLDVKEAA